MPRLPLVLAAAAVLWIVIGCAPPVDKPVITFIADRDSVARGDTVGLTATVTPSSADVQWFATAGTFSSTSSLTTRWIADSAGEHVIKAVATNDTEKDSFTRTVAVYARAPVFGFDEVCCDNIDQYVIPNPGTVYSPIRFPDDEYVENGATVDSLLVGVDIDYGGQPDSFPAMNVWVESPDGSRVKIRDESQSGDPSGDYSTSLFAAFRGKPVIGTWKLIVETIEPIEANGVVDCFTLEIQYRYRIN